MALSACNTETDSAGRELAVHGTAAFPIACYHDDLEAAPVPWHWHEELELLIASEGGVLAAAAGEKYTLAEGDGLFINAGVLPCAIMAMLVVYCLRGVDLLGPTHGLPELIAAAAVMGLHCWKKNTLLSIAAGTALYMVLVQVVFV